MELQLAIDELSLEQALKKMEALAKYIDIIEVGTPFMLDAGRRAVTEIKQKFPQKMVLYDTKIMDAGAYEARLAFESGADYVTVLGVTDNLTIKGCVEEAKKWERKIMVDMLCVDNLAVRVREVEKLGVDVIAVHTGADQQATGRTPLEDLAEMKKHVKNAKIAVAGGINSKTVYDYIALNPDIVIVGSGILNADNPVTEARLLADAIKRR